MGLRRWIYKKTGFNLKTFEYFPHLNLSKFESIGDNCEFGLFLRKSGNHKSSFFKFVRIMDYTIVNKLILDKFADIFLLENLTPITENMVLDEKNRLSFHSILSSHKKSERLEFNYTGDELLSVYKKELNKIKYLSNKFLHELKTTNKIYVIKMNDCNNFEDIYNLSETLFSMGNCKILNVRLTNDPKKHFRIEQLKPNYFVGYIDKFADYNHAPDFSFDSWRKLMKNAKKIIS